jgi:protein TonB
MDINRILKSDYLDILFDGRNKIYGGYELRRKYPQRIRKAGAVLFGLTLLLIGYPIIAGILNKDAVRPVVIVDRPVVLDPPPIDPTKPQPPPPPPAPPPPVRPTASFTPPVIKPDELVREEEKPTPPPPDAVAGIKTEIGDPNGIESPIIDMPGNSQVEAPAPPQVFTVVEVQPLFNGSLRDYLQLHLRYPEDARRRGATGRALIRFVVNEDGAVGGVEVVRTSGESSLDQEAKRVVAGMPPWKPGRQQGKAVKAYFTLPISFELGSD